jgi:hypothetical protein
MAARSRSRRSALAPFRRADRDREVGSLALSGRAPNGRRTDVIDPKLSSAVLNLNGSEGWRADPTLLLLE